MGRLMLLLLGAILGAALFHLYYRALAPAGRCGWDHPLDAQARAACQGAAADVGKAASYSSKARHDLDDLIGNVSR